MKFEDYINISSRVLLALMYKGFFREMNDEKFTKLKYKLIMKKELNLKNPVTFNEKIQWLKLYYRNPFYTNLVDKYEVRKYIANKIGEEYLIPLLGIWDKYDDIDFERLPDKFVLKCTHDCGSVIICTNKSTLDFREIKRDINNSLNTNYYYTSREWVYKNVKPRIIAEKYMSDSEDNNELTDYKFSCFNGYVDNVMVCLERRTGKPKFYFFSKDWKLLRYNIRGKNAPPNFSLPKPPNIEKMFELASELSIGMPYVRVDLYNIGGKIYFGELTFYPQSGMDPNLLDETDRYFGSLITLPQKDEKY